MAKITIEVPDDVAEKIKELEAEMERLGADTTLPVDWMKLAAGAEAVGASVVLDLKRRLLRRLDVDADHILVDGERYARVGEYEATYYAKEGPLAAMMRGVYRKCRERNSKTVDVISLRLGAVDCWLPEAATAAAFLLQQGTSREAEATARVLGVLPYSRCSFERVAHSIGELHRVVRDDVEDALITAYEPPSEARSISVALDRVAVPF
jgi:hypothetical protein